MKEVPDLYAVLELPRGASTQEVKRAYRHLVRQYHPDVSQDKERAHERFLQIADAYSILSDRLKKQEYDLVLSGLSAPPKPKRRAEREMTARQELARAQAFYVQRDFEETERLCRQTLAQGGILRRTAAAVYSLLGDALRAQRKIEEAITAYTFAVQYDPANAAHIWKLEEAARMPAVGFGETVRPRAGPAEGRRVRVAASATTGGLRRQSAGTRTQGWIIRILYVAAAVLFSLLVLVPGASTEMGFRVGNLVFGLALAVCIGGLLSLTGAVGPLGEALASWGPAWLSPWILGLGVVSIGILQFYVMLVALFVFSYAVDRTSEDLWHIIYATIGCVAIIAITARDWEASKLIVFWGGGPLFLAQLLGCGMAETMLRSLSTKAAARARTGKAFKRL